jgi:lipopolysaccharide/colanic/teichoic acid biosynthesis glycosyltransferase
MATSSTTETRSYDRWKRAGDVFVAGGALLALSPAILGTALLVRVRLGRNVLFRQERPGLNGQVFHILKFRTMLEPDPLRGLVTNEERMTEFGDRLRSTSLDELPGLINVLKGEMSLVGPRPLRTRYMERYSREQARRHEVPPGLTGLAQVSGRNALSWDDKFDLDVEYIRTRSFLVDMRILLATVPKVLRRDGITEDGQATMSEFYGPRRIGDFRIETDVDSGPMGPWKIVDHSIDEVVARGTLRRTVGSEVEMVIVTEPDLTDEDLVRARACEMLLSRARALEAGEVRIVLPEVGPECEEMCTRLGFRRQDDAGVEDAVFLRHLEGGE